MNLPGGGKLFAHDCTSLHKSAHTCTCNGYKSVRKCYKGTLPSSRPPFYRAQKGTSSQAFLFCCPKRNGHPQKGR
nr:MAG TPA: hypothetical protein [Caudoviricetes sp.]